MPNRIKVFLGVLALVAAFSVYRLGSNLSIFPSPSFSVNESALFGSLNNDPDNDGLNNFEEAFWNTDPFNPDTDGDGFLDGEEAASGHDPLIPGPDDLINKDNITKKLSSLTVAGLYEGSLKPGSGNYEKSLDTLASVIASDFVFELSDSAVGNFNLVDSTQNNQNFYLKEFSKVFEPAFSLYLSELKDIDVLLEAISKYGFANEELKDYFSVKSEQFQNYFNKSLMVNVPKNWQDEHIKFVGILSDLANVNRYATNGKNDPIKAAAALNRLVGIFEIQLSLLESYAGKIESQKLDTRGTFFAK